MKRYFFDAHPTEDAATYPTGWDRNYHAADHAEFMRQFANNGVFAHINADACKAEANGYVLEFIPGAVMVEGNMCILQGGDTLVIDGAAGYYTVICRLNRSNEVRDFELFLYFREIADLPEPMRAGDIYEMFLAQCYFDGTEVQLTDLRPDESVCGFAHLPNPEFLNNETRELLGLPLTASPNDAFRSLALLPDTKIALGLPPTAAPDDGFAKLSAAALIRRTPLTVKRSRLVSSLAPGNTFYMFRNGAAERFIFVQHNYQSALNGAGRGLAIAAENIGNQAWGTSASNSYSISTVDAMLNGAYKAGFSQADQDAIGNTNIPSGISNANPAIQTLSRSFFLLSLAEYGLSETTAVEGSAVPIAASLRTRTTNQWTRTLRSQTSSLFGMWVTTTGAVSWGNVTTSNGIFPAFTLPEDFEVVWYEDAAGNMFAEPQYEDVAETVLGETVGGFLRIAQLEYVGTGTSGANAPNTIEVGFRPKIVIVRPATGVNSGIDILGGYPWQSDSHIGNITNSTIVTIAWHGNHVSWYSTINAAAQLNNAGVRYAVMVIGSN